MSRPTPRQSGLAGRSPAQPPIAPSVQPTELPPTAPRAARPPRTIATRKDKVGFYQRPDDTARARAAFTWTHAQEAHRSFSDFVSAALMREVDRLEAKYNGGDPWPPMDAGQIPTGKPLGS